MTGAGPEKEKEKRYGYTRRWREETTFPFLHFLAGVQSNLNIFKCGWTQEDRQTVGQVVSV